MMKRFIGIMLAALPLLAATQEEKVLNVYNWSNYIAPETVRNFEKETGIKVRYDVFDTNEVLHAKLMAGHTGYDIVVPSEVWASLQIKSGLLKKLDKSQLPNLANMDPVMQAAVAKIDPGNEHLVTWLWGYTTVGINLKQVKAALGDLPMPANAWDLVFDKRYMSRLKSCGVSFMDSPSEIFAPALQYIGKDLYSNTQTDYQEALKLLKSVRPYITLFSSSGYINDMANGSICVALGWSGDINIARRRAIEAKNGVVIEALIPSTSGILFFDTMAIPQDAPHPHNALLWMNYIMRPEVHASITNTVFYANPNTASTKYVNKDIAENKTVFLSDADKKRMAAPQPVAETTRRFMSRMFTQFKTGL
ncbi:extracellular solute-binding protein [Duganella sp. FT135W]|uniref:Putrescine-binding periplasmic protein n=1 Tax=Duganella flavida TaxID=2692175 RepID=A0A6L8KEI7_9BURK|nr:polyamine ABC transporter substrate-binding protein [Duganella flavida]MYM24242.1 extracellular solute-binding protein [Duganella flavida]